MPIPNQEREVHVVLPIRQTLELFGVPIASWGTRGAKTVIDLMVEIDNGESHLRIDASGICREVEIIKMVIFHPLMLARGCLIEVSQVLPGGSCAPSQPESFRQD